MVSMFVNLPRLTRTDAESIRMLLCLNDQYSNEFQARAIELLGLRSVGTEVTRPVDLSFCVDAEHLESATALDIIAAADYESLSDAYLCAYLKARAQESKESINYDTLDHIVDRDLGMICVRSE